MRAENLYFGKTAKTPAGAIEVDTVRAFHEKNKVEGKQRHEALTINLPDGQVAGWLDGGIIFQHTKENPNDVERIIEFIQRTRGDESDSSVNTDD